MNRISYTISLEDFRSRQNGVVTSIDEYGQEMSFNKGIMIGSSEKSSGNYAMFPSDVEIPSAATECEGVLEYLSRIGWDGNVVSHKTLSRWYFQMLDYIRRVNSNGECKNDDVEEITEEERDLFFSLGGYVFVEWLERNIFPRFNADEKYEGLECHSMNTFQVSDEYAFLLGCYHDFSGKTELDIASEECCRYKKYISHGGDELLRDIEEWIDGLPSWERSVHEKDFESYVSLNVPIQTTIEDLGNMEMLADDWTRMANYRVGEEDNKSGSTVVVYNGDTWIFSASTEHDKGYYYSEYYKEAYFANPSGMTSEEKSYFEQVKREIFPGGEAVPQWVEYFDLYKDMFVNKDGSLTYAIKDGKCIYAPTPLKMSEEQYVRHIDEGAILYGGQICNIEKCRYILDSDGTKIAVKYDEDNVMRPYVMISCSMVYGSFVGLEDGMPKWRFVLTNGNTIDVTDYSFARSGRERPRAKKSDCHNEIMEEESFVIVEGEYIPYSKFKARFDDLGREDLKLVFNDYVIINGDVTPIIDNKFYHQYMDFFLEENLTTYGSVSATSKDVMESESVSVSDTHGYYFNEENGRLFVHYPYKVYYGSVVEGETRSSLEMFESDMKFFDNLGNELNGLVPRDASGAFKKISALDTIEIPYVVGTVRNTNKIDFEDEERGTVEFVSSIDADFSSSRKERVSTLSVEEAEWPEFGLSNANTYSASILEKEIVTQEHQGVMEPIETEIVIEPKEELESGFNYMVGDILEKVEYYYKDSMGNKVVSVLVDNDDFELDGSDMVYKYHVITRDPSCDDVEYIDSGAMVSGYMHSTSAVTALEEAFSAYKDEYLTTDGEYDMTKEADIHGHIYNDIYCDFTYYKGATLEQEWNIEDEAIYSITKMYDGDDTAIEYTDTCILKKDVQDFWVNDYLPCTIQYYLLNRPKESVKVSDGLEDEFFVTRFKAPLILDGKNNGDFIAAPTFRKENRLGIQDENVVGDIYIDRGVCQSIDRHLKLMSCKSVYSLEEYGNNYFNIENEG